MFNYFLNKRFMLLGVFPRSFNQEEILMELEEINSLVKTYGGTVHALSVQKGERPSSSTYLRSGKLEETTDIIKNEKIDIAVCRDNLKPGQLFTLETIFSRVNPNIKVWDKAFLILQIFDLHASSSEAKLQIKIATLRHMGPRIYGMGYILSNQGGGIGIKGIGETNTEIMKRHWKNEVFTLKKKIKDMETIRQVQMDNRRKLGVKTVSIIGYTNSGKSTLFNKLTKKEKLVDDKLFATLDSNTGKIYLKKLKKDVIVTDTIGFIRNLPPSLIDTFKSTLMESINSDLIIHLIDASDPEMYLKIYAVEKIIEELDLTSKKIIYVFNKADIAKTLNKLPIEEKFNKYSPVFISAKNDTGIKELLEKIELKLIAYKNP